ncbi:hypothetical protein [Gymnodinialimonas sp.]
MFDSLLQPKVWLAVLAGAALIGFGTFLNTDTETASDPMTRPAIVCAAQSQAFTEYFLRYAPDDLPEPSFADELDSTRTDLAAMMLDITYGVPNSGDLHENVLSEARQLSRRATDLEAAQTYIDATWTELQACAETTLAWWRSP